MCSIVVEITRNKNMKLRDRTLAEIGKFLFRYSKIRCYGNHETTIKKTT